MLINGASITMDVAPEIKSGRTMRELPLDCPGPRCQGELRRSHPDRNHGTVTLKAGKAHKIPGSLKGTRNFFARARAKICVKIAIKP